MVDGGRDCNAGGRQRECALCNVSHGSTHVVYVVREHALRDKGIGLLA